MDASLESLLEVWGAVDEVSLNIKVEVQAVEGKEYVTFTVIATGQGGPELIFQLSPLRMGNA